jgi:hypothetical protein
VFGPELVELKK